MAFYSLSPGVIEQLIALRVAALLARLYAVDHKHSVGMSSAFMSLRFSSLRHSASSLSTLSDIMGKKISSAGHTLKKSVRDRCARQLLR